jgi:prepilin-type processing-associated H-X9-DG protein
MRKKLHCTYLFADGHAVIIYEKHDRQGGEIKWAEVIEKFGPECRFEGRIVFHSGSNGMLNLCRKAVAVRATIPTLDAGSERTRELGIPVGTLEIQLGDDRLDRIYFHDLDGVLSAPYKYQPEVAETFDPQITRWRDYQVTKVQRTPAKPQAVPAKDVD